MYFGMLDYTVQKVSLVVLGKLFEFGILSHAKRLLTSRGKGLRLRLLCALYNLL